MFSLRGDTKNETTHAAVPVGGSHLLLGVGCRDGHVYALDASTGRKKWDYPTSKSWVNGTPAVRGGVVYVGTSDSARFMALDAKTGHLRFNFAAVYALQ